MMYHGVSMLSLLLYELLGNYVCDIKDKISLITV